MKHFAVLAGMICAALISTKMYAQTPVVSSAGFDAELSFSIDVSQVEGAEWEEAVMMAYSHQTGKGRYSLLRVVYDGIDLFEPVQLSSTYLVAPSWKNRGGGGLYFELGDRKFVIWDHLDRSKHESGRDTVKIGHPDTGVTMLETDIPAEGEVRVIGDIILRPCPPEKKGVLNINIAKGKEITRNAVIGAAAVGGPYGKEFPLKADGTSGPISMAPGTYKILFPDFDYKKSRWTFTIEPGMETMLDMRASSQEELELVEERRQPIGKGEKL